MPDNNDEITQRLIHLQDQIDDISLRLGKDNFSNTIIENKTIIQQTADYHSKDFVTGASGWSFSSDGSLEANDGNFRGDITGATGVFTGTVSIGSLDIPDATTASSFHVDSLGNTWWGAATLGASTAKVLNTGIGTFNTIFIEGGTFVATDILLAEQRFNTLFKRYCFIGNNTDGLTETPGGGGSVSRYLVLTTLTSGGNDCTLSSIRTHTGSGNTIFTTSNGDVEVIMSVQLGATTAQDAIWGIEDNGAKTLPVNSVITAKHFGFVVEDGTLYASNAQGATQTKTDVSGGITLTDMNIYRLKYDHLTGYTYFYINDSLVATHTTNAASLDPSLIFGINGITKKMDITNNYLIIHE